MTRLYHRPVQVSVIGSGSGHEARAEEVGRLLAERGCTVVTGGLGFVGLTLARRLVARGDIDDLVLFDAQGPAEPPEEIRDRAEIVRGDIRDGELVRTLLEDTAGVFHLASVVSAQGERDFDLAVSVNLDGGRNVLEACRALGSIHRYLLTMFLTLLALLTETTLPCTDDRARNVVALRVTR